MTRFGEDALVIGSISPSDSVTGDATIAGGDVEFHGSAGGDYVGVGGSQIVGGRVHGSIRAAGGTVTVRGTTDRNATVAGGNVVMDSTGIIARNAYFTGGNVEVNGTVNGGLLASGGAVTLNGVVGRDVEISSGELNVGPRAQIMGNLRYRVPQRRSTSIARHASPGRLPRSRRVADSACGESWFLGILLAGAVIVALFPRFMAGRRPPLPRVRSSRQLWVCVGDFWSRLPSSWRLSRESEYHSRSWQPPSI